MITTSPDQHRSKEVCMHRFHPDVLALVGRQHGVASSEQLQELGLTETQVGRMVNAKQLAVVHRAVYRLAGMPVSFESECVAVSLADSEIRISHQTAARLYGLRQMASARIHATVSHDRRPVVTDTVFVHRSRSFDVADSKLRDDRIRVTTPARTLVDLAATVGHQRLESALEHALHLRLVTIDELGETTERLAARGRSSARRMRTLLASRPIDQTPVASDLELRMEAALVGAGLPAPTRQFEVMLQTGDKIHPDLAWPNIKLAIEVDHTTWHDGAEARVVDRTRDRELRKLSWEIERVTEREIDNNLAGIVRDLRQAFERRTRESIAS
jgi:predicted transcriptional regulator of viral defense system